MSTRTSSRGRAISCLYSGISLAKVGASANGGAKKVENDTVGDQFQLKDDDNASHQEGASIPPPTPPAKPLPPVLAHQTDGTKISGSARTNPEHKKGADDDERVKSKDDGVTLHPPASEEEEMETDQTPPSMVEQALIINIGQQTQCY